MPYLSATDLKASVPDLATADDAALVALVAEFRDVVERYCGQAFDPRTVATTVESRNGWPLVLPWPVVNSITTLTYTPRWSTAVTLDSDAIAALSIDGPEVYGLVILDGSTVAISCTIDDTPPPAILRACRLFVRREWLAERAPNTGNTYMTMNDALGVIERAGTADWAAGRPTGWLDVDRLLNSVGRRDPGIA